MKYKIYTGHLYPLYEDPYDAYIIIITPERPGRKRQNEMENSCYRENNKELYELDCCAFDL